MARCMVIEGGMVVNTIEADPATDHIEGAQLISSDTAQIGWAYDGVAFTAPPAPAPQPIDLFTEKMNQGMQIISTGTPALNGTYPLDSDHQQQITGIVTAILAGRGLPGNLGAVPWPDLQGNPHNFSPAAIQDLAKAMEDYIFGLSQEYSILKAVGGTPQWPSQPVTIS